MKNPRWTRDELIVTLDSYLRYVPAVPRKTSHAVSELSSFLSKLQVKVGGSRPEKFRNRNGVYMKLMNFRRLDPEYKGKGLERGNKDEEVVWNRYYSRRDELRRVAKAIRSFALSEEILPPEFMADCYEGEEGQILTRVHQHRERDNRLVKRKKDVALKELNRLACEVCEFDFRSMYGDRGYGFIECHHKKPLSELSPEGEVTTLADLSLVCSNCHRMVHKSRPWLSIEELKSLVKSSC